MSSWELTVENRIQEAIEAGEFDNLAGRGRELFRKRVSDLNLKIQTHNLGVPSITFHRRLINAESEIHLITRNHFVAEESRDDVESSQSQGSQGSFAWLRRVLSNHVKTTTAALFLVAFALLASPAAAQTLIVRPDLPVAVAPGQPEVTADSTEGIINALCEVNLNLVGCGFHPDAVRITCDTNADGVPELLIPLTNVMTVNALLVTATIPALGPQLPGSPFPLACCGGIAALTISRTVSAGDDNIFGDFTQTLTCPIDLGERAPVVISVTPSGGDCAVGQNLLIPGSCFVRADGTFNVTRVFAVERGNPANIVESSNWQLLNPNLIDAFFQFGAANRGKTFLFFASGPNGTSRNLTSLPAGAPPGCPLGNEQGIQVSFTCQGATTSPSTPTTPPSPAPAVVVTSCSLERSASGTTSLILTGDAISGQATFTVGAIGPKKVKFKNSADQPGTFRKVVLKGKVCQGLPGRVETSYPDGRPILPFQCNLSCTQ